MESTICNYWRSGLGKEFREQALTYIGGYAENNGVLTEDADTNTYTAELDVNDVLSTIIPINIMCESSKREVRFVSKIISTGNIVRIKNPIHDRRGRKCLEVKLIDNQNEEIDTMTVCIDSLLYLLDTLDTFINNAEHHKEENSNS